MIYENVSDTIQFFDDLISSDSKQCRVFISCDKVSDKINDVNL